MQIHHLSIMAVFELKFSGLEEDKAITRMGFDRSHHVESIGFNRGGCVLWKHNIRLRILFNDLQFIYTCIEGESGHRKSMFLTFVYASPHEAISRGVWDRLLRLGSSVGDSPWGVAADFNARLSTTDRTGGSVANQLPYKCLVEWVQRSYPIDMGF